MKTCTTLALLVGGERICDISEAPCRRVSEMDKRDTYLERVGFDGKLVKSGSGRTHRGTNTSTSPLPQQDYKLKMQLRSDMNKWLVWQRHCCLRLVTSLLFTTCYVIVVYDLLRYCCYVIVVYLLHHCCLRLVTSLLFTTCYVIVVYDLLRHCCLRLVTSLQLDCVS